MGEAARLLAVDDSPTIRKALQLMLEPAGFTLEFGATGQEAVDKVKQFRPAILLLDFILPDMRGSDVCRILGSDPETASVPVVLISTKGAEIRQAYQDLDNVVYYITKPFAPDEVMRAINDVLARSAEERLAKRHPEAVAPVADVAPPPVPAAEMSAEAEPFAADGESVGEGWEPADEIASDEELEQEAANRVRIGARREALEAMFETLRTGLEGVYVEEVDTPAGAAADEAQSYTDLASRLARQLAEALDQAESRVPFRLCSDGSVRSLDETLLDTYRRVCRLLFRATGAGAVQSETVGRSLPRVLVVSKPGSEVHGRLMSLREDSATWHVFTITADVRQLPLMTRLYGPTRLVVDATYGNALWDQLKTVRALPDGQHLPILAVVPGAADGGQGSWSSLDVEPLTGAGAELMTIVRAWITHPGDVARRNAETGSVEASAAQA